MSLSSCTSQTTVDENEVSLDPSELYDDNAVDNPIYSDAAELRSPSQHSLSQSPPQLPLKSRKSVSPLQSPTKPERVPSPTSISKVISPPDFPRSPGALPEGSFMDRTHPMHCQAYGVLSKRPFGHQATRWSRRFFVLRDSYLLYYAESEKKEFESKKSFNIHPKGVIPLGGCQVEEYQEVNRPFSLIIRHKHISGCVLIAADSEYSRSKWIAQLQQAARITYQNAELGDKMITRLESEGVRMALEKQEYYDQLQSESVALQSEKERNEELSKMAQELERQKSELSELAAGLKSDLDSLRSELEETSNALTSVEEEKCNLQGMSESLQTNLKELQEERSSAEHALRAASAELQQQNQETSTVTEQLQLQLHQIEQRAAAVSQEQQDTAQRLYEAEQLAVQLREEKADICEHSQELEASIKDLSEKKSLAERELAEEMRLRQEAERQLSAAQKAVTSLQGAVRHAAPDMDVSLNEQMLADVKQLRNFFERVALESLYDAKKPALMKSALSAVRTDSVMSRARNFRRETLKRMSRVHATALQSDSLTHHTLPTRGRKNLRASHLSPV